MVEYICNRCGYNAKQKINLTRHLHRKNICSPILEDISIEEVKFIYGFEIIKDNSKSLQNHSILTPNNSKNGDDKQCCEYCLRTYSRKDNLTKHLKKCKIKTKKIVTSALYNSRADGFNFGTDLGQKEISEQLIKENVDNFLQYLNTKENLLKCTDED